MNSLVITTILLFAGALAVMEISPEEQLQETERLFYHFLPREFPSIAHIHIKNSQKYATCMGSLIKEKWILTVAHCVYNKKPSDIQIHLDDVRYRLISNVSAIFTHPLFNPKQFSNDIALLKLKRRFKDIKRIPTILDIPVKFHARYRTISSQVRFDVTPAILNWHQSNNSSPVEVVAQKIDKRLFCDHIPVKNVICTQTLIDDNSVIRGDSGSPLIALYFISRRHGYAHYQIGILSYLKRLVDYSYGTYVQTIVGQVIGYVSTNLFNFVPWMRRIIRVHGKDLKTLIDDDDVDSSTIKFPLAAGD